MVHQLVGVAVIAVAPGAAAVEIVVRPHIQLRGETVGIAIVCRVGVIVGVAVDDPVIGGAAAELDTRITVFEKRAVFHNIIGAAINLQTVVARPGDIQPLPSVVTLICAEIWSKGRKRIMNNCGGLIFTDFII